MNRAEFERLRDLPDKVVAADIVWASPRDAKPNLIFEQVPVENSLGLAVVLNGTYKPDIPAVTYNFVLLGVGPICRVEVNGTYHPGAGRTHKHDLRRESDPRQNLPTAIARPDLENLGPGALWQVLCKQAGITHTGAFSDPEQAP